MSKEASKQVIIRVKDVMKNNFDKVDGSDTVQSALQKMEHQESHVLIVNKRNDDDEYGMVLLADIAKKLLQKIVRLSVLIFMKLCQSP